MRDRRVHWRLRLAALLAAALVSVAGALAAVTPAQAVTDTTCTLTFRINWWNTVDGQERWQVDGSLVNTGTWPSTTWRASISFPTSSGAVIRQYWNTAPADKSGVRWKPASWNGVIQPHKQANFGFEVRTPRSVVLPQPAESRCTITYADPSPLPS